MEHSNDPSMIHEIFNSIMLYGSMAVYLILSSLVVEAQYVLGAL